jgi:hypothetical protein
LFTIGYNFISKGIGDQRDLVKPFLSPQSPQIVVHMNPPVWWSVFNFHRNEGVCKEYFGIIPSKTGLVNKLWGIFHDLEIDQDNPLQSLRFCNT